MSKKIYTIGYEGATAEQLIATLANMQVSVLADVRALPLSRKRGLSKRSLAEGLASSGIGYSHFKQLGDPKPGRDAARSGNYALFEEVYGAHIHSEPSQVALAELLKLAERETVAMLCFERCATHCHRSFIADFAVDAGFEVYNLVADRPDEYLKDDITIPRHYSRKSLAAAE